jgi:adenylate cyclase class 2
MIDEIEVKIRVDESDLEGIRADLKRLGFHPRAHRAKEDNVLLDFPDKSLRRSGCALRLRRYGSKQIVTFKGKKQDDPHLKVREEIESQISDLDALKGILTHLGLEPAIEYSKYREKYILEKEGHRVEFCIDETSVGSFIEIEGTRDSIYEIAAELGWDSSDFITKDYVELLGEGEND